MLGIKSILSASVRRPIILRNLVQLEQRAFLSHSVRCLNEKKAIDNDALNDIGNISLDKIKINRDLLSSTTKKAGSKMGADDARDNIFDFSSWKAASVMGVLLAAGYYFISKEKARLEIEKEAESNRPVVGGEFELIDSNGNKFTDKDLLGHFSLLYFGFSKCPDVCPAELDKLSVWLNTLGKKRKEKVQPLFITCDPIRDSPKVLKSYLKDFHEDILGLTGTYDQIKDMCQKYKVFFSTPRNANPKNDYIVDHSTFFYLLDPEGKFIDALGDIYDEQEGLEKIEAHMNAYLPKAEREKRMNSWYSFLFK